MRIVGLDCSLVTVSFHTQINGAPLLFSVLPLVVVVAARKAWMAQVENPLIPCVMSALGLPVDEMLTACARRARRPLACRVRPSGLLTRSGEEKSICNEGREGF